MRCLRFAALLSTCVLLTACGSEDWMGDTAPPPLPGKRISVLAHSKALEADGGTPTSIILPPPDLVADWPQAGGYPPHAMYHLALGDHLKEVWSSGIAGNSDRRAMLTTPVVAGGTVFVLDTDNIVWAFDLKNGHRKWKVDLTPEDAGDGSSGGGVAVDDGKLFATTGFGQLVAMNVADGKVLWRQSLPAPVRGAPTVRAGRVLVITVENETLALAAEDGHQLWHHNGINEQAMLQGGTSAAVDGNVVLVPYSSGELFALRIENGTTLWSDVVSSLKRTDQVSTMTDIRGLPVVDRGRVYAAGNSDITTAIDLRSGRRLWDREVGSTQTPWVAGEYLYLVTNNSEVVCFESKTGKIRWVTPLQMWNDEEHKKGRIIWNGPVLASDRLVLASSEGEALSLSPYTGELLGRVELPEGIQIPPIVADNTLIFVTTDGDLVAYR